MSKLLAIVATALFVVGFILVAFGASVDRQVVQAFLWLGLACLAGAHAT